MSGVLYPLAELKEEDGIRLYDYIKANNPDYRQSYPEFIEYMGGEAANFGYNCFVCIEEGQIAGCIAIVTKEVPEKGEAFIFNFYADQGRPSAAIRLLRKAADVCSSAHASIIRIGRAPSSVHLHEAIIAEGYVECYKALVMALDLPSFSSRSVSLSRRLQFSPVDAGNMESYRTIHNETFRYSSNGGSLSNEQMLELMENNGYDPELLGLAWHENRYVGIYELDLPGGLGWINTIGVDEHERGRGFGREIAAHAVDILIRKGSRDIKLIVMSDNVRALQLYQSLGFREEKVLSVWYSSAP